MLTLENLIGDPREIECFSREPIANSAPRISVETSASMIKEKGRFRRYVFTFTREEKLDSRFKFMEMGPNVGARQRCDFKPVEPCILPHVRS